MPDVTRRAVLPLLGLCLLLSLAPGRAPAAYVEPLDGRGSFHSYVDVVNRWRDDQHVDVVVLVSVANGDLSTEAEDGGRVARLRVEVTLTAPDGREVTRTRHIRTRPLDATEAASQSLRQVCGVLLTDVPFRSGRLTCTVTDVNRRRTGLLYQLKRDNSFTYSEAVGEWYADASPRPAEGLALGDPLYLIQAPLAEWNPDRAIDADESSGFLTDYVHPNRIYGLEQDRLQLALPVWPPAGGTSRPQDLAGLRLDIVSTDEIYALHDSVSFDARGRAALETGRPATLFYTLDVNDLPAGTYRLSVGPLSAQGRGLVSSFAVVWELGQLLRQHDLVMGEGVTVFDGAERDRFVAASPTEREAMLAEFWRRLNPEPDSPVNRVQLEFQYRLAYVQQFLGGIGRDGANDARGEVFLLLGPPDEVQREPMPTNYREQDDARVRVYDRFAPERPGETAKGAMPVGQGHASPYETLGGIPLVDQPSRAAEKDRQEMVYKASQNHGFEMWRYDRGGAPLFVNRLSHKGMGQRFLFVDADGSGHYKLESSNIVKSDE